MRLVSLIGILLVLAMACTTSDAPVASSAPVRIIDGAQLEQFVKRLYTRPAGVSPEIQGEPQILLGELPPGFDVRSPDGTSVLGSVVHGDSSFQAILDAPMERQEAQKFYSEALVEAGWRGQNRPEQRGFTGSSESIPLGFCSDKNIVLYMFLSDSPIDGFTEARIQGTNYDDLLPSICDERAVGEQSRGPVSSVPRQISSDDVLPSLKSPGGVISMRTSTGMSRNESESSATSEVSLNTEMSAADLEEHYRKQLEDLNWDLVEKGATGPVAVSTWRFIDEDGEDLWGLLWVVEGPHEDQRTALIKVTRLGN